MKELQASNQISSLELVEQINIFRNEIEGKSEIGHNDLLKVIRDEFEEEISLGKISPSKYKNSRGKEYPMFNLTHAQAKQVLVRESKAVRKATIKHIEELEAKVTHQIPKTQAEMFAMAGQAMLEMETRQKELEHKVIATETKVDNITEIVALSTTDWRKDSASLLNKMALNLGGYEHIRALREESYKLLEQRANCKLSIRLTNKRQRMADEGVCLSKRNKLNPLDVIADDKKLIEIYVAVVKDMSIRHGVAS